MLEQISDRTFAAQVHHHLSAACVVNVISHFPSATCSVTHSPIPFLPPLLRVSNSSWHFHQWIPVAVLRTRRRSARRGPAERNSEHSRRRSAHGAESSSADSGRGETSPLWLTTVVPFARMKNAGRILYLPNRSIYDRSEPNAVLLLVR